MSNAGRLRRVLVTGASGFVGQLLVPSLVQMGWHVHAAVRNPGARPHWPTSDVTMVEMPDLATATADQWQRLLADTHAVVHLAGIAHADTAISDDRYHLINAKAVHTLGEATARTGARMIFLSSVRAQSGATAPHVLTEADAPLPTDAYGRSKLAGEIGLLDRVPTAIVLRPVLIYGPGAKGNFKLLESLARLPLPLPLGSLESRRSFLGIKNLCDVIGWALETDQQPVLGRRLLVADPGPGCRIKDLVEWMRTARARRAGVFQLNPAILEGLSAIIGKRSVFERISKPLLVSTAALENAGSPKLLETKAAIQQMA